MAASYPTLKLESKRATSVQYHHPWIFSGGIIRNETEFPIHGAIVFICDAQNHILATGTYSAHSQIAVRVLEFGEVDISTQWFINKFHNAERDRAIFGYDLYTETTGYRLIFGEADGIPGLIVDRFGETIVIQIATAGMDQLRQMIIAALIEVFHPKCIVEKSDISEREREKLPIVRSVVYGSLPKCGVQFQEYGVTYIADVLAGQKTGFFLDQKDLRNFVKRYAAQKQIVNLFSYSGATGISAFVGGATSIHNVDSSEQALALCAQHAQLHHIPADRFTCENADIFQWVAQKQKQFDMVVMDPPALIKSQKHIDAGIKAYHFLNRAALRFVKKGGLFVTSSCSQHLTQEELLRIVRKASIQNNQQIRILHIIHQSPDHPISAYFPESFYLKSIIGMVT
ncbi:MAG TPA: class I SAM-dependent rRNA methyltransferase [Patescibacteria group bacterium]|nr:class I SAM-dependent rRNA methyltransferase [Patescibacteria group bacterium]